MFARAGGTGLSQRPGALERGACRPFRGDVDRGGERRRGAAAPEDAVRARPRAVRAASITAAPRAAATAARRCSAESPSRRSSARSSSMRARARRRRSVRGCRRSRLSCDVIAHGSPPPSSRRPRSPRTRRRSAKRRGDAGGASAPSTQPARAPALAAPMCRRLKRAVASRREYRYRSARAPIDRFGEAALLDGAARAPSAPKEFATTTVPSASPCSRRRPEGACISSIRSSLVVTRAPTISLSAPSTRSAPRPLQLRRLDRCAARAASTRSVARQQHERWVTPLRVIVCGPIAGACVVERRLARARRPPLFGKAVPPERTSLRRARATAPPTSATPLPRLVARGGTERVRELASRIPRTAPPAGEHRPPPAPRRAAAAAAAAALVVQRASERERPRSPRRSSARRLEPARVVRRRARPSYAALARSPRSSTLQCASPWKSSADPAPLVRSMMPSRPSRGRAPSGDGGRVRAPRAARAGGEHLVARVRRAFVNVSTLSNCRRREGGEIAVALRRMRALTREHAQRRVAS